MDENFLKIITVIILRLKKIKKFKKTADPKSFKIFSKDFQDNIYFIETDEPDLYFFLFSLSGIFIFHFWGYF